MENSIKQNVVAYVSFALIAMMFLLIIAVLAKWLFTSSVDNNMLIMVAQAIISMCTAVAGYYLGSSEGSRKKDEALKQPVILPIETVGVKPK